MGIEELEKNLSRIHEWIRAADQKVNIFLAFQGIILTILFPVVSQMTDKSLFIFSAPNLFLVLTVIFFVAYSIFKCLFALVSRTGKKGHKKSLLFFGDVSSYKIEEYKKQLKTVSRTKYREDLIDQVYISSKIAYVKHVQFQEALIFFAIGISLFFTSYLLSIFNRVYGF